MRFVFTRLLLAVIAIAPLTACYPFWGDNDNRGESDTSYTVQLTYLASVIQSARSQVEPTAVGGIYTNVVGSGAINSSSDINNLQVEFRDHVDQIGCGRLASQALNEHRSLTISGKALLSQAITSIIAPQPQQTNAGGSAMPPQPAPDVRFSLEFQTLTACRLGDPLPQPSTQTISIHLTQVNAPSASTPPSTGTTSSGSGTASPGSTSGANTAIAALAYPVDYPSGIITGLGTYAFLAIDPLPNMPSPVSGSTAIQSVVVELDASAQTMDCLTKASQASINNSGLDIIGDGQILPTPMTAGAATAQTAMACPAPGGCPAYPASIEIITIRSCEISPAGSTPNLTVQFSKLTSVDIAYTNSVPGQTYVSFTGSGDVTNVPNFSITNTGVSVTFNAATDAQNCTSKAQLAKSNGSGFVIHGTGSAFQPMMGMPCYADPNTGSSVCPPVPLVSANFDTITSCEIISPPMAP